MNEAQLSPIAEILVQSYLDTAVYSSMFKEERGDRPTTMAKVHHLRSVAQVLVRQHEGLELSDSYAEFGRVEVTDLKTSRKYLLRGDTSASIEQIDRRNALFDASQYIQYQPSDVILAIYKFADEGLELSLAGTKRRSDRTHLEASGPASYVGSWPYTAVTPDTPFDQEAIDPFEELGDLDEGEEEAL